MRVKLKKILSPVFAPFYRGKGLILMFHRVLPNDGRPRVHTQGLEVTPEKLEEIIRIFKEKSFDFIRIGELENRLREKRSNRFVAFTFDDGYIDNLTEALPVFVRNQVPFTVYVTTDMPDGKMLLWHYMLEEFLLNNDSFEFEMQGTKVHFEVGSQEAKEAAFTKIRRYLIDLKPNVRREVVMNWFGHEIVDRMIKKHAMSWNDVVELSGSEWVEIGAHSVTHPGFSALSEEEMAQEVRESKRILEDKIGKPVNHFAYPYGSKNEVGIREINFLNHSDFLSAVTTRQGNIFRSHLKHMSALPRINITSRITDRILEDWVSGKEGFIRNTRKKVITL